MGLNDEILNRKTRASLFLKVVKTTNVIQLNLCFDLNVLNYHLADLQNFSYRCYDEF